MKKFKASLTADYPFIADPEGQLLKLFDVKYPLFTVAKRITFVIGKDRKVLKVFEGSNALDPNHAINACMNY